MRWSLLVTVTTIGAGFGMPTNCARAVPVARTIVATTSAADHSPRIAGPLCRHKHLKLGRRALKNLQAFPKIFFDALKICDRWATSTSCSFRLPPPYDLEGHKPYRTSLTEQYPRMEPLRVLQY